MLPNKSLTKCILEELCQVHLYHQELPVPQVTRDAQIPWARILFGTNSMSSNGSVYALIHV